MLLLLYEYIEHEKWRCTIFIECDSRDRDNEKSSPFSLGTLRACVRLISAFDTLLRSFPVTLTETLLIR